jgi:hypothetical protein
MLVHRQPLLPNAEIDCAANDRRVEDSGSNDALSTKRVAVEF